MTITYLTTPALQRQAVLLLAGYVNVTLDQLLYHGGFMPVLQCVLTKAYKMPGLSLYTDAGVTRGRKLVVLVAQPRAVAIAVKGHHKRRRWSKLREWLALPSVA